MSILARFVGSTIVFTAADLGCQATLQVAPYYNLVRKRLLFFDFVYAVLVVERVKVEHRSGKMLKCCLIISLVQCA